MTGTSRQGMTARMRECLEFIEQRVDQTGLPPSYAEMVEGLGLRSTSSVARLVEALVERGHLYRGGVGCARTIWPASRVPAPDEWAEALPAAAEIARQEGLTIKEYITQLVFRDTLLRAGL